MVKPRKPKMAGNQVPQNPEEVNLNLSVSMNGKGKWQVHYARFFNYPCLPSTCPSLRPMNSRCKSKKPFGNWVSSSSAASVQLAHDPSGFRGGGMVLIVSFQGKIYEEHYVSPLLFSWPQVQCLEECPVRGSRVLFASYRHSLGQVQKFAMCFSASSDLQTSLKSLKNMRNVGGLKDSGLQSKFPSPSEFISSNGCDDRAIEKVSNANPVENFQCQIQPSECMQFTCPENRTQGHGQEVSCSILPASFTALLLDSCTVMGQEVPNRPVAFDLKSQVVGFMTSSPFNEFLCKLEMVIEELGGDLALRH